MRVSKRPHIRLLVFLSADSQQFDLFIKPPPGLVQLIQLAYVHTRLVQTGSRLPQDTVAGCLCLHPEGHLPTS